MVRESNKKQTSFFSGNENQLSDKATPIAPAAKIVNSHIAQWIGHPVVSSRIVASISQYLYLDGQDHDYYEVGRTYLRRTVDQMVELQEPIEMVFPAFPFKSPSSKKVLGELPDLAEELLLRRLELLALSIEDYYAPGAVVRIVSDGIVYGQILGRSEETVYHYNAELRRLVQQLGLAHITFVRLIDLLDSPGAPLSTSDLSLETYIRTAPDARQQLLEQEVPGFDLANALSSDYGVLMTYRGYLKFLCADLEGTELMKDEDGNLLSKRAQEKVRSAVAKKMLINGSKFSQLVQRRFPTAVRLSCHPHKQTGPKFGITLFPGHAMNASPWHNTILEKEDGSLTIGSYSSFKAISHVVVKRYGRPYYLRALTDVHDLGEAVNPHISFLRNFPFGMTILANPEAKLSLQDLPMDRIRTLTNRYSALLLRGFSAVNRETFRRKCDEMGEVMTWPKFGAILELKENPALDMNSSLTCESMPMHYDGVFKTKTLPDGTLTHDPPRYQAFQCIHAVDGAQGGQTLLTNTAELLRHGLNPKERDWIKEKTYSVYTPLNQVFGGDLLKLPMIMKNEETGHDVLRWHENWPQHVTKYRPAEAFINNVSPEESATMGDRLTDLLYDRRFCYAHTWSSGDYLFADNIENLYCPVSSQGNYPRNYGVVLFPGFQILDVFGPLDVLNVLSSDVQLNLSIIAKDLQPVSNRLENPNSVGSRFSQSVVPTHTFDNPPEDLEVLLVPGGYGNRDAENIRPTDEFLKKIYPSLKYLITVCTGSASAARAGILDGRKATTNKRAYKEVVPLGPKVTWIPKARWVVDGNVWTSSGISAGIDVTLAFIKEFHGEKVAVDIANRLEYERHDDPSWDPFAELYGLDTSS